MLLTTAVFAQAARAAPAPVADYQLHNSLLSSVPGAPPINDIGSGNAFATETINGCATRVRTFPLHNGLGADMSAPKPLCTGKVRTLVPQPATVSVANAFPLPMSLIGGAPGTEERRLSWNW